MLPFFDPRPGYYAQRSEVDAAIQRVLESGHLILGPEVQAFEEEFRHFVGAQHAVGVGSGTDAISLALRALGVGPGDEVITVANAGAPPVAAIRAIGAHPRFVDVLPGPLVMDPGQLPLALTPRTRCILPVHLYGHPVPLHEITAFAQTHGLTVVEDCAQAHGTRYRGRHVGTFGSVGCFSFYPTKNLGAFGDGGMCVTNDAALAERLRMQRTYGFRNDRHAHTEGINSRLDELQAAVLRVKLAYLADALAARRRIAARYDQGLRSVGVRLPGSPPQGEHAYHLYVIQSADRARLIERLEHADIGFGVHYPVPAHQMDAYLPFARPGGVLPISERASSEVLSLPLFPELDPRDVERVIAVLGGADDA